MLSSECGASTAGKTAASSSAAAGASTRSASFFFSLASVGRFLHLLPVRVSLTQCLPPHRLHSTFSGSEQGTRSMYKPILGTRRILSVFGQENCGRTPRRREHEYDKTKWNSRYYNEIFRSRALFRPRESGVQ